MTTATPPAPYSTWEGALASGFAITQLHHSAGHDPSSCPTRHIPPKQAARYGQSMSQIRFVPHRSFPLYAYLPGRQPHPVRDPDGHSYKCEPAPVIASLEAVEFLWGCDLFNHGYYWEAHEAWEGLWHALEKGDALKNLLKALILLSAAGVKIREGKGAAAVRHAGRGAALLRGDNRLLGKAFSQALGSSPDWIASCAEATAINPPVLRVTLLGHPEPVFDFYIGNQQQPRTTIHT